MVGGSCRYAATSTVSVVQSVFCLVADATEGTRVIICDYAIPAVRGDQPLGRSPVDVVPFCGAGTHTPGGGLRCPEPGELFGGGSIIPIPLVVPQGLHNPHSTQVAASVDGAGGPRTSAFCYGCNVLAFTRLQQSGSSPGVRICLTVPLSCPACDKRRVSETKLGGTAYCVEVDFVVPYKVHAFHMANSEYKVANPKRNTHTTLVQSIEGPDIDDFTPHEEALLALLPRVYHLLSVRKLRANACDDEVSTALSAYGVCQAALALVPLPFHFGVSFALCSAVSGLVAWGVTAFRRYATFPVVSTKECDNLWAKRQPFVDELRLVYNGGYGIAGHAAVGYAVDAAGPESELDGGQSSSLSSATPSRHPLILLGDGLLRESDQVSVVSEKETEAEGFFSIVWEYGAFCQCFRTLAVSCATDKPMVSRSNLQSIGLDRIGKKQAKDKARKEARKAEKVAVKESKYGPVATSAGSALVDRQEQVVADHGGDVGTRIIKDAEPFHSCEELATAPHNSAGPHQLVASKGKMPTRLRHDFDQLVGIDWSPTWGTVEVRLRHDGVAWKVGPMLGAACVWDNKDLITSLAAVPPRCVPTLKYDPTADVSVRMRTIVTALRDNIFTRNNIRAALAKIGLAEDLGGKRGPEEVRDILNDLAVKLGLDEMIDVIAKLEVTAKPNKPPRLVFNEGQYRQVLALVIVGVFESLLFDYCDVACIKHKTRHEFAEQICREMASDRMRDDVPLKLIGVECDQTKFDVHENQYKDAEGNIVGLLVDELKLLDRIEANLPQAFHEAGESWKKVRAQESKPETKAKFRSKTKNDSSRIHTVKIVMNWLYRTSGNRRTSSGNYVQSICAALATHTLNGQIFWEQRYQPFKYAGLKHFKWTFVGLDGKQLYFRFWGEGDDFIGQTERHTKVWASEGFNGKTIPELYAQLGLAAKLVYVVGSAAEPERAEFCGIHFLSRDGKTVPGAYCPDVMRGLITSGVSVCSGGAYERAVAVIGGFWMKAIMFAGRVDAMAFYYRALAQCHMRELPNKLMAQVMDQEVVVGFDVESVTGCKAASFASLERLFDNGMAGSRLPNAVAVQLLSASVGANVGYREVSRWEGAAPSVTIDMPAREVYAFLPKAMAGKLENSFR